MPDGVPSSGQRAHGNLAAGLRIAAALLAFCILWAPQAALATINVISDQIVDGSGNPYQRPGGGAVTMDDLGLGTVPLGSKSVKVVPWSTIPGDIGQMQHF